MEVRRVCDLDGFQIASTTFTVELGTRGEVWNRLTIGQRMNEPNAAAHFSESPVTPTRTTSLDSLRILYEDVNRLAAQVAVDHGPRLKCCRGCSQCCVDDLTVFEIEAEHIRTAHQAVLAQQSPHPTGACAFLDMEGACRIYADRPYVCRTQGLPLRWIDEDDQGDFVELRDICPLNEDGPPIEELDEEACWTIGPTEERLARLQFEFGEGRMTRVPLRSLFQ